MLLEKYAFKFSVSSKCCIHSGMIYHHDTGCHAKSLRELLIPSAPNFLLPPLLEIGTKDRYDLGT